MVKTEQEPRSKVHVLSSKQGRRLTAEVPAMDNTADEVETRALREELDHIIDRLTIRQKMVLHWSGIIDLPEMGEPEDLTPQEMAGRLEVSESRISVLKKSGLNRLTRIALARNLDEYLHPRDTVLYVPKPPEKPKKKISAQSVGLAQKEKQQRIKAEAEYLSSEENRKRFAKTLGKIVNSWNYSRKEVPIAINRLGKLDDFSFGKIPFSTIKTEDFMIALVREQPITMETVIARILVFYNLQEESSYNYYGHDVPHYLFWDKEKRELLPIE